MPVTIDQRREFFRDLAGAGGWAVFIGGGIALGLALGSVGADVPADGGMLWYVGLIVGVGTLIVRLGMVAWKHRGLAGVATAATPSSARRPPGDEREAAEAGLEPVGAPAHKQAASGRPAGAKRAPAKGGGSKRAPAKGGGSKPAGSRSPSPTRSSTRSASGTSSTKKKPAPGAGKPRPKPRKKPNG